LAKNIYSSIHIPFWVLLLPKEKGKATTWNQHNVTSNAPEKLTLPLTVEYISYYGKH